MSKPVDIHCHVFNRDILTYRILFNLIESLVFAFIYRQKKKVNSNEITAFAGELRRIVNFLKAAMKESSVEVYNEMQAEYSKVYNQDFIITPLTFDLYFCFKGSMRIKKKEEEISGEEMKSLTGNINRRVLVLLDKLEDEKVSLFKLKKHENFPSLTTKELEKLKDEIGSMIDFFKGKLNSAISEMREVKLVGSFKKQLNEVVQLRDLYPDRVFPFFAVDPRRFNIVNMAKKNVSKNGPFFGIKIYAPNGYSPTDPDLLKIYEFCVNENIPVTAHCSHVGFATFENTIRINGLINHPEKGLIEMKNEKYSFSIPFLGEDWIDERASVLNDPAIWEEVLKKFPGLKLNLAHFGKWDKGLDWTNRIFRLMHEYPTLYTDLSCVSEIEILEVFKAYWDGTRSDVKERFLYGSDYYFNLLYANSFNAYLQNFRELFSDNEFNQIAVVNPRKFLEIDI